MGQEIVGCALDIGKRMLRSGGEVSRVEDTIRRILTSYGYVSVDVFTITSQIQVNATDAQGNVDHQFRRIYQWGTDLRELERLNQLSRDICVSKPKPQTVREMIRGGKDCAGSDTLTAYVGAVLAAGGFCLFFGGKMTDAIGTAFLALLITFLNRRAHTKSENRLSYYFFFSAVTGFAGALLTMLGLRIGLRLDLDKMLIGCIMLTIPGIAITYAVRDMLLGETITGLLRFIDSLLIAASIACGFVLSSMMLGG